MEDEKRRRSGDFTKRQRASPLHLLLLLLPIQPPPFLLFIPLHHLLLYSFPPLLLSSSPPPSPPLFSLILFAQLCDPRFDGTQHTSPQLSNSFFPKHEDALLRPVINDTFLRVRLCAFWKSTRSSGLNEAPGSYKEKEEEEKRKMGEEKWRMERSREAERDLISGHCCVSSARRLRGKAVIPTPKMKEKGREGGGKRRASTRQGARG